VCATIKPANLKRVKRIEGRARDIIAMGEADRACADNIRQCTAATESLRSGATSPLPGRCADHALHRDDAQRAQMVKEVIDLVGRSAR